ncbi:hypothetical protein WJX72_008513 [[Myrmecia] bisecta]|uniref:Uncharacterized protein n=1 Tax=[Myrmecia] bisecta TaxID=41462 RepID=A0AAW1R7Y3_9CHLO
MAENVQAALKEAERVVKKQKTCASKTIDAVDTLIREIAAARKRILAEQNTDAGSVLQELHKKLDRLDLTSQLAKETKDLHSAVNKLSKALDKAFVPDICKASREVQFDKGTLNQVIAQHFYQTGRFAVGDTFVREAQIPDSHALKEPFSAMHEILKEIRQHNLAPALAWAAEHCEELAATGAAAFEFKLHRLQFLNTLQQHGPGAALQYARMHFDAFKDSQMAEIQRLMGCLCYIKRPTSSPYADLMAPSQWEEVAREFARQCCGLMGQAYESPLLVSVAAGTVALPTLLKLATVMAGQGNQDLKTCEQLPVELELGNEFVFHSIFACPVSRDQSSPANPPMLLPCGHVLCEQSILKIAKSPTRSFKCPYCPVEATRSACRQIIFPDLQ